ncbi:unnamed protein product, partial [Brenthis ino]
MYRKRQREPPRERASSSNLDSLSATMEAILNRLTTLEQRTGTPGPTTHTERGITPPPPTAAEPTLALAARHVARAWPASLAPPAPRHYQRRHRRTSLSVLLTR